MITHQQHPSRSSTLFNRKHCEYAMTMTPVAALQIERGETPLELRRQELQLQYAAKLKASRDNPTKSITDDCWQNYKNYPDGRETFAMKTKKLSNIIGSCDVITQNEYSENAILETERP